MNLQEIDKIFVLNLPERHDRRLIVETEMSLHGLNYEVFPSIKDENGILGLLKTMQSVFEESIKRGYKKIWVCEDDCMFLMPVKPFLDVVMLQIPENFHCFYLGLNLTSKPERISWNILRILSAYSTHSIIYNIEAIKLIINELNKNEIIPYDILLMQRIQSLGRCFCSIPMMATQRSGYSDIDKCERQWGNLMSVTYAMQTKNI